MAYKDLFYISKNKLKKYLVRKVLDRLPNLHEEKYFNQNFNKLRYKSDNNSLKNLLLSFRVFNPIINGEDNVKFNFYEYDIREWSFEHISPQNPKGIVKIPKYAQLYVINEIEKRIESELRKFKTSTNNDLDTNGLENSYIVNLKGLKTKVEQGQKIDANEVEFLFDSEIDEHSLGNMAFLSREDNSAHNNNPFMIKKLIIQDKKSKGAFIPSHTFDVFNKILVSTDANKPFSAENFVWTQQDVDAHIEWMKDSNKQIIDWVTNYLEKQLKQEDII